MPKSMQNYLELHRHAVVRLTLLANPGTAFRLMVPALPSGGDRQKRYSRQIDLDQRSIVPDRIKSIVNRWSDDGYSKSGGASHDSASPNSDPVERP